MIGRWCSVHRRIRWRQIGHARCDIVAGCGFPDLFIANLFNALLTRRTSDVPIELVSAQEKGQTIFVCGAGVSRGAGLPLFRGLVEGVSGGNTLLQHSKKLVGVLSPRFGHQYGRFCRWAAASAVHVPRLSGHWIYKPNGHLDYGQRAFWNPCDSDLHG
jgi:hypothetical protein